MPPTAVAPVPDVPDGDELLSVVLMVDLVVEVVVSVEVFVGTGRSTRGGFVPHASTARWASRAGDTGRTPVVFSDGQSSGSPASEMFVASSQEPETDQPVIRSSTGSLRGTILPPMRKAEHSIVVAARTSSTERA